MPSRQKGRKGKQSRSVSKQKLARLSLVRRLGNEKQAAEFVKRGSARQKALEADPIFDHETERLRTEIQTAHSYNPQAIESFFERFPLPLFFHLEQARAFMKTLAPGIQVVLEKYIRYSSRFGVYFVCRKQQFEVRYLPTNGWKFHVKQVDGHLEPLHPAPQDDDVAEYFESQELKVPPQIQRLIDSHQAKYVRIDDSSGCSVLNDLESFAYHPEGITLVLHGAERPYLLCLYGEKVSKELLDRAGTAVSAFQREHYERGKGGRPANLARRKKVRELLKQPGSIKDKAAQVETTENISSSQSFVSRVRKETT
jgi:hypothetical protein